MWSVICGMEERGGLIRPVDDRNMSSRGMEVWRYGDEGRRSVEWKKRG